MTQSSGAEGPLGRSFHLRERGTGIRSEVIAGITTFSSMSYILAVNPLVLSSAGMDHIQLITVTALASMIGTLIMALWANLPLALAPGMAGNVIFANVVVQRMGVPFPVALAMVFTSALIFLTLSLTGWRERIIRSFPDPMRIGIQASLGLFIAWIGLKNSGLLLVGQGHVAFAPLGDPAHILAYVAVLITVVLVALRVPAGLLASIIAVSLIGLWVPDGNGGTVTRLPQSLVAWPAAPSQMFLALDFPGFAGNFLTLLPVLLYFCINDFFGVTATLVGVTRRAGLLGPDGRIPNARQAYAADGIASAAGAALGTSTVGVFVESATGVEAGARTGLASLTVALLFGLSCFFWPLLAVIPAQATAPALIVVGLLMLEAVVDLDRSHVENAIPPLLMVVVTACTTDLMAGFATGCVMYTLLVAGKRGLRAVSPMLWGIDAVLVLYLALAARIG